MVIYLQDIGINSDIDMPSGNSEAHREPFASTELVGERSLIAKPPPPTGLVLSGRPLKAKAPMNQEPRAVYSTESYFKRGTTPVRMLGDLVNIIWNSFVKKEKFMECYGYINRYGLPKELPA